ncbi:hypothetical protein SAMN02910358_02394 [Lachnospiraceae bacterium XBB1006]|nr:hypothetical protein SAMN02910358_02394 [Lachnospiraceae bacterium XBB1006]
MVKRIAYIVGVLLILRIVYILQCTVGYVALLEGKTSIVNVVRFPMYTNLGITVIFGLVLGYVFRNKIQAKSKATVIFGLLIIGTLFIDPSVICDFTYKHIWSGVYDSVILQIVKNHIVNPLQLNNYDMTVYYFPDAILNLVVGYAVMMVEIYVLTERKSIMDHDIIRDND